MMNVKQHVVSILIMMFLLVSCNSALQVDSVVMPVANTITINDSDTKDSILIKAAHVVPTANQYEALKNEFIAFIHFGPNTFTRMEWGSGMEDPKIFDLVDLDTDQWCKAMKEAAMKMVIITVKHHDGFVLWQSRYTDHGVMSTPFKNGKGDILKELSESCEKYDLKLGVYLSPADLYQIENKHGLYGNLSDYTERTIPRAVKGRPFKNKTTFTFKVDDYNEYFLNQLFELLTEYGPIHEVWFDGAHPKRKGGQQYNYRAWKKLIRQLAPEAVVFGKEDVRWCGNESGGTRDTEWNVIPYQEDPHNMNRFADITVEDIGSREKLYHAKYLHYQQAEINTSIREGWFYRDDTEQKVRNADDVFDIYERSVGGNSTFLLNIPPNRSGRFSNEDVSVLKEVGKRIRETYGTDLFDGAVGPDTVLDANEKSFEVLADESKTLTIETKAPITINRLVLQEAITTHGERVEEHIVDAWVNGDWKQIAAATNIGYKRILRFPEVTSDKFRVSILKSRWYPVISNITAHFYKTRPPQLDILQTIDGKVNIMTKKHQFGWKPHGEDSSGNLNMDLEIRYTTDGSAPTKDSPLFKAPFELSSGEVKAVAYAQEEMGSIASKKIGIAKDSWKVIAKDSHASKHEGKFAIDGDSKTYWQSVENETSHYLEIDLGMAHELRAFGYTPQKEVSEGMIEKGYVKTSVDGKKWTKLEDFEFGNLINDPTQRIHYFKSPINTRYFKIESQRIAGGKKTAAIAELDLYVK